MIFICTSMYIEALPIIRELKLKKDINLSKYQVFKNDDIVLIITGVGKINGAIGVTYLLTQYKLSSFDFLINIGICGTTNKDIGIGEIFLCNKIIENDTKKNFYPYPDVLFKHPFKENTIKTCSSVVDKEDLTFQGKLIDMESSGIFEAGIRFLKSYQLFFIKIVSDYLDKDFIDREIILKLIENKSLEILNWIMYIKNNFSYNTKILSNDEDNIIKSLINNLNLSCTMGNRLKQILTYYKLQHGDFKTILDEYIKMNCNSKNDGKGYFENLKKKLI